MCFHGGISIPSHLVSGFAATAFCCTEAATFLVSAQLFSNCPDAAQVHPHSAPSPLQPLCYPLDSLSFASKSGLWGNPLLLEWMQPPTPPGGPSSNAQVSITSIREAEHRGLGSLNPLKGIKLVCMETRGWKRKLRFLHVSCCCFGAHSPSDGLQQQWHLAIRQPLCSWQPGQRFADSGDWKLLSFQPRTTASWGQALEELVQKVIISATNCWLPVFPGFL